MLISGSRDLNIKGLIRRNWTCSCDLEDFLNFKLVEVEPKCFQDRGNKSSLQNWTLLEPLLLLTFLTKRLIKHFASTGVGAYFLCGSLHRKWKFCQLLEILETRRSSSYFASSQTSISMTLKTPNGYCAPSGVSGYTPGQICYFLNDSKYLCGSVKPLNASVFPRLPLMDKWFITSKKPPERRWRLIYIAGCNLGAFG